jgi:hypothetical protein
VTKGLSAAAVAAHFTELCALNYAQPSDLLLIQGEKARRRKINEKRFHAMMAGGFAHKTRQAASGRLSIDAE